MTNITNNLSTPSVLFPANRTLIKAKEIPKNTEQPIFHPYWAAKTSVAFPFNIAGNEHGTASGQGKGRFIYDQFSDDPAGCKRCPVVVQPIRPAVYPSTTE